MGIKIFAYSEFLRRHAIHLLINFYGVYAQKDTLYLPVHSKTNNPLAHHKYAKVL